MGSSASKSMGRVTCLDSTQEGLIFEMFQSKSKGGVPPITVAMLNNIWDSILSASVQNQFVMYLFSVNPKSATISIDRFMSMYVKLVCEPLEVKAEILFQILGISQQQKTAVVATEKEEVSIKSLQEYIKDMWSSYIRILESTTSQRLKSWKRTKLSLDQEDLLHYAKFLCQDVEVYDSKIGRGSLESWLLRCGVIGEVFETVLKAMYNQKLPARSFSLLPEVLNLQTADSVLLNLPQVFFLNTSLPQENRSKWRLLFSTKQDGFSWSTLLTSVMGQGATIIVIEARPAEEESSVPEEEVSDSASSKDADSEASSIVFGGFASSSWRPSPHFYGDENCFLFSLRPEIKRFDPTGYNRNYQYFNTGQQTFPNGLGMGGQLNYWGFFLNGDDFGQGKVSESCSTFRQYEPPVFKSRAADQYKSSPSASPNALRRVIEEGLGSFSVSDLEIWGVGKPDPSPQELGERKPLHVDLRGMTDVDDVGSALGRDKATEAFLEMAGRELHSRNLAGRNEPEEDPGH